MSDIPAPRVSFGRLRAETFDRFGLAIMLFAGFNLNAIAFVVSGRKSLLSPVMLPITLMLLWNRFDRRAVSSVYLIFLSFMGSYLVFGGLSNPAALDLPGIFGTYLTTLLFVSAVYFWTSSLADQGMASILNVMRWIFIIASVFTVLSPLLAGAAPSLSSEPDRFSGLFENPDETATAALYGIVLVLCCPTASLLLNVGQLIILGTALALTFSKNGILIAIAISVSLAFRRGSASRAAAVIGIWMVLLGVAWVIYDRELIELTPLQHGRLGQLFEVLGGEIDDKTTTGRTVLLDFGLAKIKELFPAGAGLGEFHALEGGYRNPLGDWLGIHNTYLMVLGESGLVPFLLLLGFVARMLWLGVQRSIYSPLVMGLAIVLFGNMTSTHNALALRFSNVMLGLMIALASRVEHQLAARRGLQVVPHIRR